MPPGDARRTLQGRPVREPWTCPDGGRGFANRNQWHAWAPLRVAAEFLGWLAAAYRVGAQQHLRRGEPGRR